MSENTFTYKKFTDRNGDEVVAMDLYKYTDECLKLGLGKETAKDFIMVCPYCNSEAYMHDPSYEGKPYTKWKLYVGKNKQYGHCFRCGCRFVNESDEIRLGFSVPEPPIAVDDFELVKLSGPEWNLARFEKYSKEDKYGVEYLVHKRHYLMRDLYKYLDIRFDENHNPVIPFRYHGELIYFQIKNAYGGLPYDIPYFSPPILHKPAYIIEHGTNDKIVICEGVFDAIACLIMYKDRTPFALLGSSITNYQLAMLRSYVPTDILVYLDDTSLSQKVASKIGRYLDYAEINIVPSPYGQDPEEKLKYNIIMNNND